MFLYSAVASLLARSKDFTLLMADLFINTSSIDKYS